MKLNNHTISFLFCHHCIYIPLCICFTFYLEILIKNIMIVTNKEFFHIFLKNYDRKKEKIFSHFLFSNFRTFNCLFQIFIGKSCNTDAPSSFSCIMLQTISPIISMCLHKIIQYCRFRVEPGD